MWNAETYDDYYRAFSGAVDDFVDWELLRSHLPQNKDARILDAAGGTGRVTLRLANLGYRVTLSDISPEMLIFARAKMDKNNVLDKVNIMECDNNHLPFPDNYFDMVICWDGAFDSRHELFRVTKKGGIVSIFLSNKWSHIFDDFYKKPDESLKLAKSKLAKIQDFGDEYTPITVDEARTLFESEGIRVIDIYAVCGWTDYLSIPEKILKSREWDNGLFEKTTQLVLHLSKEPSLKGLTRHLVLYGQKL